LFCCPTPLQILAMMEALIVSAKIHESHVLVHKIKSDYLPT